MLENTYTNQLVDRFNDVYRKLYDRTLSLPAGLYNELVNRFDASDYDTAVLAAFNRARKDIVSSDRESCAFMLAYDQMQGR